MPQEEHADHRCHLLLHLDHLQLGVRQGHLEDAEPNPNYKHTFRCK